MAKNGTITYVDEIPNCEANEDHGKAFADAKVPGKGWGNWCLQCFIDFGCALGLGRGQELVVRPKLKCSGGAEAHEQHMAINGECPWEHK